MCKLGLALSHQEAEPPERLAGGQRGLVRLQPARQRKCAAVQHCRRRVAGQVCGDAGCCTRCRSRCDSMPQAMQGDAVLLQTAHAWTHCCTYMSSSRLLGYDFPMHHKPYMHCRPNTAWCAWAGHQSCGAGICLRSPPCVPSITQSGRHGAQPANTECSRRRGGRRAGAGVRILGPHLGAGGRRACARPRAAQLGRQGAAGRPVAAVRLAVPVVGRLRASWAC